jgi:hypothetical protein
LRLTEAYTTITLLLFHNELRLMMLSLGLLVTGLLSTVASCSLDAREELAAAPVFVQATSAGNGCPQDSDTSITGNFNNAKVRFDKFAVSTLNTERKADTSNCGLHFVGKGAQPGYQVAITDAEIWGNVNLKNGTTFSWFATQFNSQNAVVTVSYRTTTTADWQS